MSRHSLASLTLLIGLLTGLTWAQPPTFHWPLDEASGTLAADVTGSFNGTLEGATWGTGITGAAVSLDGENDRVSMTGPGLSGTAITIACWFHADDFDTGDARLISRAQGTSESDHDWMLSTVSSGGQYRLRARLRTGGSTKTLIGSNGVLSPGTWFHTALVYDGSQMRLYQDGVEVGSASKSGAVDERSGLSVAFGNQPSGAGSRPFDGLIDDVRIYNRALDSAEIASLADPCSGDPVATFSLNPSRGVVPVAVSFDASTSSDCDGTLVDYAWDFGDGNTGTGVSASHTYTQPGNYSVQLTVEDNSGLTATASQTVEASDGAPIAHWSMDEGAGPSIQDTQGNYPGAIEGAAWTQGFLGSALAFDGSDDRVALPGPGMTGNAMTLALWFKADDFGTSDARLISRASGTNANDHDWMLSTVSSGSESRLRVRLRVNGSTTTLAASSGAIASDTWTHAAYTYDGIQLRLYLNGALVGSAPLSGAIDERGALSVAIGNQPQGAGSRPFDGVIDEVHIYDRALNASELTELANPCTGIPVAAFDVQTSGILAPVTVTLDASASSDCDGSLTNYAWDFGDGQTGQGATTNHTYTTAGTFTINLTVTDDSGNQASFEQAVVVRDESPLAHWSLDEGTGSVAADAAGSYDGTVQGATWATGLFGSALAFDGIDNRVALSGPGMSGDQMTLSCWFNADDFGTNDARLISRASGTNANDHDWMLSTVSDGGTMRLRARLRVNGSTTTLVGSGGVIQTGVWTHASWVFDGSELRLYQDGSLVGTASISGTVDERASLTVAFGNQPNGAGSRPFDGLIDDIRIYDRALDATEISELADPCNGLPNASFTLNASGVVVPVNVDFDASDSSDCDGTITSYDWDFGDGSTAQGSIASHTYNNPGTFTVTLTVSDDQGNTATFSETLELTDGSPVSHWPLNEGSGVTALDVEGDFDGSLEGPTWTTGLLGGALEFDGSNDRVSMSGPGIDGNAISLACWFNADDFDTSDARLISRASGTNASDHDWMLSTVSSGGGIRLRARLRTQGNGTTTLIADSDLILPNRWIHAALVYDGSTMRLYQDGSEVGVALVSGEVDERSGLTVALGNQPSSAGSRPFDGTIDDVRIYDRALTPAEVSQLADPCDGFPIALFDVQITPPPTAPATVSFDASLSSDCDGTISTYDWDFGDGANAQVATTTHVYNDPGIYTATLTVTDNSGNQASSTQNITIFEEGARIFAGLLTEYHFDAESGSLIADVSGLAPALDLTIADPTRVAWLECGGLSFEDATLAESSGAATKLTQAITASQALTLEAWLQTADLAQNGPARIATLSDDGSNRNLTLAQDGSTYVVRLRTTTNGINGTNVVTQSQAGSVVTELTHVLYTRAADGTAKIWINGLLAVENTVDGDLSNWDPNYAFGLANELNDPRPWLGALHLVAVYDRALSETEVQQNFNAGIPPSSTNPNCNRTPVARAQADLMFGEAPLLVNFDSAGSHDLDGTLSSFDWSFGDGTQASGQQVDHTFADPGIYDVQLTVVDDDGASATRNLLVVVVPPGQPHRVNQGIMTLYAFREGQGEEVLDLAGGSMPADLSIQDPANSNWLSCGGLAIIDDTILGPITGRPFHDAIQMTQGITLEAWVQPENTTQGPSSPARVITLSDTPTERNFTLGQKASEWDVRFRTSQTGSNGNSPSTTTSGSLATTELTHVVFTWDSSGTTQLYVDGVPSGSENVGSDISNWDPNYAFALANEVNPQERSFIGDYHMVALYDRALTASEVDQNYQAGVYGISVLDPLVSISADPNPALINQAVSFTSATQTGCDATIASYDWDFGDSTSSSDAQPSHAFGDPGTYAVTCTVTDSAGRTATDEVDVEVIGNRPPVANDLTVQTDEDTSLAITLEASDPDDDPLTFIWQSTPSLGSFQGTPPNVTYIPDPDVFGQEVVSYLANDGELDSNIATLTIDITPVNDPPTADPIQTSTLQDQSVAITLSGSDPEDDPLTFAVATQPSNGSLSGTEPNLTYSPNSGYTGQDSFTYTAFDGSDSSNPATVTIDVQEDAFYLTLAPLNGAPMDGRWVNTATQEYLVTVGSAVTGTSVQIAGYPDEILDISSGQSPWTASLPEGAYQVQFVYTDGVRNEVVNLPLNIDRTPPVVDWTGMPTGTLAGAATPLQAAIEDELSGLVNAFFSDGQGLSELFQGDPTHLWNWSAPVEGDQWIITAQAQDAAGNSAQDTTTIDLEYDFAFTVVGLNGSPTDGSWTNLSSLSYLVSVGQHVTDVVVDVPGVTNQALVLNQGEAVWEPNLPEGDHLVHFHASGFNQFQDTLTFPIRVDRTAPAVTWSGIPEYAPFSTNVQMSADLVDGLSGIDTGSIRDDFSQVVDYTGDSHLMWAWVSPGTGTSWLLTAEASDLAGNSLLQTRAITLTQDFYLELIALGGAPLGGEWVNTATQDYQVNVGADVVSVIVKVPGYPDESLTLDNQVAFWTAQFPENAYAVVFEYSDAGTQTGQHPLPLNIDRSAPTIDWTPMPQNAGLGRSTPLSVTLSDTLSGVAASEFSDDFGNVIGFGSETQPAWTWDAPSSGTEWVLHATVEDSVGNQDTQDWTIQLAEDFFLSLTPIDGAPMDGTWVNTVSQTYEVTIGADVTSVIVQIDSFPHEPLDLSATPIQWTASLLEGSFSVVFAYAGDFGQSGQETLTLNLDRTPPTIDLSSLPQFAQFGVDVELSAAVDDPLSGIASASFSDDQGNTAAYVDQSPVVWTWTSPLSGSDWIIDAQAQDLAGNSAQDSHTIQLSSDFYLELIAIDGAPLMGEWVNTETQSYEAHVGVDVSEVEVIIDGQLPVPLDLNAQVAPWTAVLDEGDHSVEFVYRDSQLNEGRHFLPLRIDRTPPAFSWSPPPQVNPGEVVPFHATVSDPLSGMAELAISDGQNPTIGYSGIAQIDWSWTSPLTSSTWTIDVLARDQAGNEFTDSATINVETGTPSELVILWNTPPNGFVTNATTQACEGVIQSGLLQTLTINGVTATLNGTAFTVNLDLIDEGITWLDLIATDTQGGSVRERRQMIVDRKPPTITVEGGLVQVGTGDELRVRGHLTDQWDPAPTIHLPDHPNVDDQIIAFAFGPYADTTFPLTLEAVDHVGNSAQVTVQWQPEPSGGVQVTLTASPTTAATGETVWLQAVATPLGDSPIRHIDLFRMDGDTPKLFATGDSAVLNSSLAIPFQPQAGVLKFEAIAETEDGSQATANLDVPVNGNLLLEGYVFDAETGHPLPAAQVVLMPSNQVLAVDDRGYYRSWRLESVDHVLVSAAGTNQVRLQGPFNPGTVSQLPDARLTTWGSLSGSHTTEGAERLAVATSQPWHTPTEHPATQTSVSWSGSAAFAELSNQALPLALPLGWTPLVALELGNGSGAGSWSGPAREASWLISTASSEGTWRVEADARTIWNLSLSADRSYAWVVADGAGPMSLTIGEALPAQAEYPEPSDLDVMTNPPVSIARSGATSAVRVAQGNLDYPSGSRALILREETYVGWNPTSGHQVETPIPQQVILYRAPDGGARGYLPLVPRHDDLLPNVRFARIGGPARSVTQDPGQWSAQEPIQLDVLPGWVLTASSTDRFWVRADQLPSATLKLFDWQLLGAFSLAYAAPVGSLAFELNQFAADPAQAGRVLLVQERANPLGARYRVIARLNGSGQMVLFPNRALDEGVYYVMEAPIAPVLGSVSLDPPASGFARVSQNPLGDETPGWLALNAGAYELQGRSSARGDGSLAIQINGQETSPNWVIPTQPSSLELVTSIPDPGSTISVTPEFFMEFNYPVDLTSITPTSLEFLVNGTSRQMDWRWEDGGLRVLGKLKNLIDQPENHRLQGGDQVQINGSAAIKAVNGLVLTPFSLAYSVPANPVSLPLEPANLMLVYNEATREAVINTTGPIGPKGTLVEAFNAQNSSYHNLVQTVPGQPYTLTVHAELLDPIDITLTAPNGQVRTSVLNVYYRAEPSDTHVEVVLGPNGGTFQVPSIGAFTLQPDAVDDVRDIVFDRWSGTEPDFDAAEDVTTHFWTVNGLQNEYGVPGLTWKPEIAVDENGLPDRMQQICQALPYTPEWLRVQLEAEEMDVPERPLLELASPIINQAYTDIEIEFIPDYLLGEPPAGKRIAWAIPFAETQMTLAVNSILQGGGWEGRGGIKYGRVGAFDYKQTVVDGLGTLQGNDGDPVGGAWVMGQLELGATGRQLPARIARTDNEGAYWGSSQWWLPGDVQTFGLPTYATHPAFIGLAKLIYVKTVHEDFPPTQLLGLLAPDSYTRRDFGFWYVDPDGGIGNARPPGIGLDLVSTKVFDSNGKVNVQLSANLKSNARVELGRDLEFIWKIDDQADLTHSVIALLDGIAVPGRVESSESAGKTVVVHLPPPSVGAHQVKITVRNQHGVEMYASFGFVVLPAGGGDGIEPAAGPPFVLKQAVVPQPLDRKGTNEDDQGEINGAQLIFLPFSEPIMTGDPDSLRQQITAEVRKVGSAGGEWKPWPIAFLDETDLEPIESNIEAKSFYIQPLGTLPNNFVLRLTVNSAGSIQDIGTASSPKSLEEDTDFGSGIHYEAEYLTKPESGSYKPFTENRVVDYAVFGKYLFELQYEKFYPKVVTYKISASYNLEKVRETYVWDTRAALFAYLNSGARSLAFWPNPEAGEIPGYIIVGFAGNTTTYDGGLAVGRATRFKIYNPNIEQDITVLNPTKVDAARVGGMAISTEQSDRIGHLSVSDGILWVNTLWGGIYAMDLKAILKYYDDSSDLKTWLEQNRDRPPHATLHGLFVPNNAILERFMPYHLDEDFVVSGGFLSPFQTEIGRVPADPQERQGLESVLWGTGGLALDQYGGDPPDEFLLMGLDASYRPFDPYGVDRYDTNAERIAIWDVDDDKYDDRITYWSADDSNLQGGPPLLGRGAIGEKFRPIYIKIVPQVQSAEMDKPLDIAVMRANPRESKHGGLMFAGLESRTSVTYYAYLRFSKPIRNIQVDKQRQRVAAICEDGRLMVIDIATWIDLGLKFKDNPMDADLQELDERLSNQNEPIEPGDFLPGMLLDIDVEDANFPLAFMEDRLIVGHQDNDGGDKQYEVRLRSELFINPGFYPDDATGTRARVAEIDVIPQAAHDGSDEGLMLNLEFSLREDASVKLVTVDEDGQETVIWMGEEPLKSAKGANIHRLNFPLSKIDLYEADAAAAGIPVAIKRKIRLKGQPVRDPSDDEDANLWVDLQVDPWGIGEAHLNAFDEVEPWSGRATLNHAEFDPLAFPGAPMDFDRRYSSQGFWDGSLGRGWFVPWDSKLNWSVLANESDQWIQIRLPNGEVVAAQNVGGEWTIDNDRYRDNENFSIDAQLDGEGDSEPFPDLITIKWGTDEFIFQYVRQFTAGSFAAIPDDIKYSLNEDGKVDNSDRLRQGRYRIQTWRRETGGTPAGWVFGHEDDKGQHISQITSDFDTYTIKLEYKRQAYTRQQGLRVLEITSADLPGRARAEYAQDEKEEDFLLLQKASSEQRGFGDWEYQYKERSIGLSGSLEVVTRLPETVTSPFKAVTAYTFGLQNEQEGLPPGMSWPYVSSVNHQDHTQQSWSYMWQEELTGRTLESTLNETLNGSSQNLVWGYDNDGFQSNILKNGYFTFIDFSQWPESFSMDFPTGVSEQLEFDNFFRLTKRTVTSNDGSPTDSPTYEYRGNSTLITTITHVDNRVESMSYDSFGRPTKVDDGLGGIIQIGSYKGNTMLVAEQTDETGNSTTYEYDVLGRVTKSITRDYQVSNNYNANGYSAQHKGAGGLDYTENLSYQVTSSGFTVTSELSSGDGISPSMRTVQEFDAWAQLTRSTRNGSTLYEARDYKLGGPGSETLQWELNGSVRRTTYTTTWAGDVADAIWVGDNLLWSGDPDNYGRYTVTRDFDRGLLQDITYNNLGQMTTIKKYSLDRSDLLEDVDINYGSLTSQTITRNFSTYDLSFTPGSTWRRSITGPGVSLFESGSGGRLHAVNGTVKGRSISRQVTLTGDQEYVFQTSVPKSVSKKISGDGRALSITSNGKTLNQKFTGYGQVRETKSGETLIYQLQSLTGHNQRASFISGGEQAQESYQGALLRSQQVGDHTNLQVQDWDPLGRPSSFMLQGEAFTVDRAPGYENVIRSAKKINSAKYYDGLGRMVEQTIRDLRTPEELGDDDRATSYTWKARFGYGVEGPNHGGPGDNKVFEQVDGAGSTNFYYSALGELLRADEIPEPSSKRAKAEARSWYTEHGTEEHGGKTWITVTNTGPEGFAFVQKFDEEGRLRAVEQNDVVIIDQEFDDQGRLAREIDVLGRERTFSYNNDLQLPWLEIMRAGDEEHITLYTYDGNQRLVERRNRVQRDEEGNFVGGITWTYSYDSMGRRTHTYRLDDQGDPVLWEQLTFATNSNLVTERIDNRGVTWTMTYDPATGELAERSNSEGQVENWTYSDGGRNVLYQRGDLSVRVRRDDQGNILEHTVNDTQSWTYGYLEGAKVPETETHPDGRVVSRQFDGFGNPVSVSYSDGVNTLDVDQFFDGQDRLIGYQASNGQSADFQYDPLGQLASETWQLANHSEPLTTRYQYDRAGNNTGVTFPSGRRVQRRFNPAGRLAAISEGGYQQASFDYNQFGDLSRVLQAGSEATYGYDDFGRIVDHLLAIAPSTAQASTRHETFSYGEGSPHPDDMTGHALQWGDVSLEESFSYHPMGMLTQHEVTAVSGIPGIQVGVTQIQHGPFGQVDSMQTPYGEMSYQYNALGQLTQQSFQGKTTDYAYDLAGRLLLETESDGVGVTGYERAFTYDPMGMLSSLTERGPPDDELTQLFEFDQFGRMRGQRNGATEAIGWNFFTLSPAIRGNEQTLPIAAAQGTLTQEVLMTTRAGRGQPQVLGYTYGPAGLNHVSTFPTGSWSAGSISPQLADPFQNVIGMLEPHAMNQAPGVATLAMASHWDVWGNGVSLDPVTLLDGVATLPFDGSLANVLGQTWGIAPEELGLSGYGNELDPDTGAAWAAQAKHKLLPGYSGKLRVGGLLDPPDEARQAPSGLATTPLGALHDLGARLYSPLSQRFTQPDTWSMFQVNRDHFTADRYLYANANPVMNWDADGRLTSLKLAMGYTNMVGDIDDIQYAQTRSEWFKAQWNRLKGEYGFKLSVVGAILDAGSAILPYNKLAVFADGFNTLNSLFQGDLKGAALSAGSGIVTFFSGVRVAALPKLLRIFKTIKVLRTARAIVTTMEALDMADAAYDVLVGGGDLDSALLEGYGIESSILEAQALVKGQETCFLEGTEVQTGDGNYVPIESVQVGDRVRSEADEERPSPAVDPEHWRKVTLWMPTRGDPSDYIEIEMIRPLEWLAALGIEAGKPVFMVLDEMGIQSDALVMAVEDCPAIEAGPGRLVLTTFTTHTDDLLELTLAEFDEPIYLTDEHLVYSDDRNDWVPADELDVGECVLTEEGSACVAAVQWRTGVFAIHNLEVDTTHSYYVEGDLLTHNARLRARAGGRMFRFVPRRGSTVNVKQTTSGALRTSFAKIERSNIGLGTGTNASSRRLARSLGYADDDAGHAIGRLLGGNGGSRSGNIFPQNLTVNRGAFARFEREVADHVLAGDTVYVRVLFKYSGRSNRPNEIVYQVRVNGKRLREAFLNP